jgi:hypothetical protein
MTTTTAIIIGNGPSRKYFDLKELQKKGTTFGCNALYRDFPEVDFLIAIDDGMIEEIKASDFPQEKFIIPPEIERWEPWEFVPSQYRPRSNAGMNAMSEAIKRGYTNLICVGYDFLIEDNVLRLGNVYEGTSGYGPETRTSPADSVRRRAYLAWFMRKHKDVQFTFLFPNLAIEVRIPNINNVLVTTKL